MPEGNVVHRLARDHKRLFAGGPVAVSSPQGRFSAAAAELDGLLLVDVEAWGKHLFYELEGERIVHVHLGLFGKYRQHPVPPPAPGPNVRLRLAGTTAAVDLSGPTACELVTPDDRDAVLARLGADPIRRDADPERAWAALRRRRVPIGAALLDQAVFAGVGNIYRVEALHVLGIDPDRPANELTREEFDHLWALLVRWMRQGARDGRLVTLRGRERHVYKREHCRSCGGEIRRWEQANRWSYACRNCQTA